ncbi:MAG: alpha/beta hydrolase [Cyclobacteriaceae bacterium]|nr:alpha/beta hydrolase [Cyclobacteriaceae bacterium HetDA_MAG_MS6]
MRGNFIDTFRVAFKNGYDSLNPQIKLIETDFGKIRVLDTQEDKPTIINVPDGPNVIEHHEYLVEKLSKNFRVICFEFPGFGFSYPNPRYDYSLDKSADIILSLIDLLKVDRAALSFSCANGFYAIKAAQVAPEKFTHLFLAQTPSLCAMKSWATQTIPRVLTMPVLGQITNAFLEKKLANSWYKYALPRGHDISDYQSKAVDAIKNGGCFCLSGLVQGLAKDMNSTLNALEVPATLVWGSKDFTHRRTSSESILEHLPNCEIIEFDNCGHFPELENTNHYVKLLNERL